MSVRKRSGGFAVEAGVARVKDGTNNKESIWGRDEHK